jgi:hypothetical protein
MYGILIAGLLALGAACGATMRLPLFVVILLGVGLIVVIGGLVQGGGILLNLVISMVTTQVGYAGGIALRAAISSLRSQRPDATAETDDKRLTIGEKPR